MPGTLPKFRSFFKVTKKISDLTYLVNFGSRGLDQVIYVDRMRKKRAQFFSGENNELQEKSEDPEDSGSIDCDDNIQSVVVCQQIADPLELVNLSVGYMIMKQIYGTIYFRLPRRQTHKRRAY